MPCLPPRRAPISFAPLHGVMKGAGFLPLDCVPSVSGEGRWAVKALADKRIGPLAIARFIGQEQSMAKGTQP